MRELMLYTDHLRVRVDLDLGAEITHLENAAGENMLFYADWKSPLPVSSGTSYGSGVYDWLSEYRGGWQELFPNAGSPCDVLGTPLPFHGEVSRAHWTAVWNEDSRDVSLSTSARLPLLLTRRMRLDPDRPVLMIEEHVRNESGLTVPYIWGHHPAFGPPLAAPGARIDLPSCALTVDAGLDGPAVDLLPNSSHAWGAVTNRLGEPVDIATIPEAPIQRLCYLHDLDAGWYALRNPATGHGLGMNWDKATFPNLWLWQEIGGGMGMPWYGRGAITALEPATQYPSHGLAAAVEAGTAHMLAPYAEASTRLTVVLFAATDAPVTAVDADGSVRW
jgi:hypothetical protein